jgi:dihydrofolate reductase
VVEVRPGEQAEPAAATMGVVTARYDAVADTDDLRSTIRRSTVRTLASFITTTIDGFYVGADDEFDWPIVDDEFTAFSVEQLQGADTLVFGRTTYVGMAEYWASPDGIADNPAEAPLLNDSPKVVVSSTLAPADASWGPTEVVTGDLAARFGEIKARTGGELLVLASPTLTNGLIEAGVLDELRLLVNPVALGAGRSVFATAAGRVAMELLDVRRFESGSLLVTYRPR